MKSSLTICIFALTSINVLSISTDTIYVKKTYDKAREYIESGNNGKAIPLLEEIVAIKRDTLVDFNSQYFKLYNILGVLYKNLGDTTHINKTIKTLNSLRVLKLK
ncbi:MAG: hypothetical protein HXX16_04865 [Bacteroidales bacterium]|nr:hypothetical protein [Bacteroidales bacterium]